MALTERQLEVAAIIAKTGRDLGATQEQITAALSGAWIESRLGTLDGGDRGTAWGIFQQRPINDWGTKAQVQNPYYAANAFFKGAGTNRGLLDVWNDARSPGLNVQAVQRSAHPYRYDGAWSFARSVYAQLENIVGTPILSDSILDDIRQSQIGNDDSILDDIRQSQIGIKQAEPGSSTNVQKILMLSVGLLLILLALGHLSK